MTEQTKSLIRHVLTALGFVIGLVGLDKFIPVVSFLTTNLDGIWAAVTALVGFVTALAGFFKNKERFVITDRSTKGV